MASQDKGQRPLRTTLIGAGVLAVLGLILVFGGVPALLAIFGGGSDDAPSIDAQLETKMQERGWEPPINAEGGVVIATVNGCKVTLKWFGDQGGYRITRLESKTDTSKAVNIDDKHELGGINIRKAVVLDVLDDRGSDLPCR